MTNVSRLNRSNFSTMRKIDTASKRMENVDYLLKIERKNRQQQQLMFEKKLQKIDSELDSCQNELKNSIKNLNKEEQIIYEIQKKNLEKFKKEILKYENIYNEIKEKAESLGNELIQNQQVEELLFNQTFMIKEDYLSYNNELSLLREEVQIHLDNLKTLEKDYPKEYKFIQEDFQLENQLRNLKTNLNNNNIKIKNMKKENINLEDNREQLLKQIVLIQNSDNSNKEIEKLNSDTKLNDLENEITKNISNLLLWNNLKNIIKNFFGTSPKEAETLILALNENLNIVKEELLDFKKEKISEKSLIDEEIENFRNKNKKLNTGEEEKNEYNQILSLQDQSSKIINILQEIDEDEKELEQLFNKYIYLIKNKSPDDDENFEMRFKNEIISLITKKSNLNINELKSISDLIEEYFKELNIKEKQLKELKEINSKIVNQLNSLNKDIDLINDKIINNENEIKEKTNENIKLEKEIKEVKETINIRDKNLRTNLETLGDVQFKSYLETNEETLKNMEKIYGKKILNKVFKVQKEKFLENVILDHTFKKAKINEYIYFMGTYSEKCEFYKKEMDYLDSNYKSLIQKFESCLNIIDEKKKEKNILEEAKSDLKTKMQFILNDQVKEIQLEKTQLQLKHNINFYLEKIKELNESINDLEEEKKKLLEQFDKFTKDFNDREHKLQYEHNELKNTNQTMNNLDDDQTLIGNSSENITLKNIKKKSQPKTGSLMSIDETIKRTLNDFNKLGCVELLTLNTNNVNNLNESIDSLSKKKNSLFQKLRPLISGINLFKRFDNVNLTLTNRKKFEPLKADKFPPEECGYTLRLFKINSKKETLEIKEISQKKNNHYEKSFNLFDIEDIFLGQCASKLLKAKEGKLVKLDKDTKFLIKHDFVSFTLVLTNQKIDLIAPNYITFTYFDAAIKSIIKSPDEVSLALKTIN